MSQASSRCSSNARVRNKQFLCNKLQYVLLAIIFDIGGGGGYGRGEGASSEYGREGAGGIGGRHDGYGVGGEHSAGYGGGSSGGHGVGGEHGVDYGGRGRVESSRGYNACLLGVFTKKKKEV
ncbi:glycine-rich cell wall structural protein 1.8-like [Prosopis cineraria]|uniref:glycine-rich cell wall structural protein 1.8-like n=1 Tax=Prosopis cineraria TaxID=364024 RepID=UPI00240FEBA0|nr:glycine-rich cell wall structural protein 1.8-like [Prosopis cineraria]